MKTVLSLCDHTGNMVRDWADAGYRCVCVDLQHPPGSTVEGSITFMGGDVLEYCPPRDVAILFAFPPCTNTAVSGARWFREKGLRGLIEALTVFNRCVEMAEELGCPYLIENPVSTVSSYYRKPDFTFHPNEYAGYENGSNDTYTKKTCLWTGNGFVMPEKRPLAVTDTRIHYASPGPERANFRSMTPRGFARAVYEEMSKRIAPITESRRT